MEPIVADNVPSQRGPRRASTVPVSFSRPSDQVVMERQRVRKSEPKRRNSQKYGRRSGRSDSPMSDSEESIPFVRPNPRRPSRLDYGTGDQSKDDEPDVNGDTYDFSLPRHSKSPLSEDRLWNESEPSVQTKANSESQHFIGGRMVGSTHHVCHSHYNGNGSIGGPHSAKLEVLHDSKNTQPSLFRWIHFEDSAMVFEDFQNGVAHIPALTNIERAGLAKLLRQVQKKYDKPLQTLKGSKVRFMEPGCMQEVLSQGDSLKGKISRPRTVTWLCFPYFCLEKYSGVLSASRPGAHPMRTLLQARSSLLRKERDLQQAVCNVIGTPEGFCFHIAHIWWLMLDDTLLVTCARIPMSTLQGDSISFISRPTPEQPKGMTSRILVSYGGSMLWLFRVEDCQTWFAFLSNFWEFWPRRIQILYNGKVLSANLWPKILDLARHTSSNVWLNFQLGSIQSPTVQGILNTPEPSSIPGDAGLGTSIDAQESEALQSQLDTSANKSQAFTSSQDGSMTQLNNRANDDIHVFTWLNTEEVNDNTKHARVTKTQLHDDLERMDHYLRRKTSLSERSAYKDCIEVSHSIVYRLLEQEGRNIEGLPAKDQKEMSNKMIKQLIYEQRVDIVNAAQTTFQFFLPLTFEGPTVLKYWGAIYQLLLMSSPNEPEDQPEELKRRQKTKEVVHFGDKHVWDVGESLKQIVRDIQPFKDLFSHAEPTDQSHIEIPVELWRAWLHLIVSLAYCPRHSAPWEEQMKKGSGLMYKGMKKMVQSLTQKSLLEKTVFRPFEVSSLVNFQLLQDITGAHPDISETYTAYLKELELDVEANPLKRNHQDRITLMKQELSVIRKTLRKQEEVLSSMAASDLNRSAYRKESDTRSYREEENYQRKSHRSTQGSRETHYPSRFESMTTNSRDYPSYHTSLGVEIGYVEDPSEASQSQLLPTEPGTYRDLLSQEYFGLVQKRIQDFDEMKEDAIDLEEWNIQQINSNKDRQESAIYAFTIVTVIFLPLSTVASILGMNTKDVRNMEINQWVYWAVALPLTCIIILLCTWTGELGNIRIGFADVWRRRGRDLALQEQISGVAGADGESVLAIDP